MIYKAKYGNDESALEPIAVASADFGRFPRCQGRRWNLNGWRDALAGGWQIGDILRLQSGSPLAVTQATNLNAFAGFGIQRPNRIADPTLRSGERSTIRWFNMAAFTQAPQFTIGNASRNPVVGPGYQALDLMVGKTFPINKHVRAEFRAEAFNVTNAPPLTAPNTSFGTAAFGTITRALDPGFSNWY